MLTPGFILTVIGILFAVLNAVNERWPLWPAVVCLGLAQLVSVAR